MLYERMSKIARGKKIKDHHLLAFSVFLGGDAIYFCPVL